MIKDMNFPCGLLTKTLRFYCRGLRFDPYWGTKISHALWHSKKKKRLKILVITVNLGVYLLKIGGYERR